MSKHQKPLESTQVDLGSPGLDLPDSLPDLASVVWDDPTELWFHIHAGIQPGLD
jgi:hypothetical protein